MDRRPLGTGSLLRQPSGSTGPRGMPQISEKRLRLCIAIESGEAAPVTGLLEEHSGRLSLKYATCLIEKDLLE